MFSFSEQHPWPCFSRTKDSHVRDEALRTRTCCRAGSMQGPALSTCDGCSWIVLSDPLDRLLRPTTGVVCAACRWGLLNPLRRRPSQQQLYSLGTGFLITLENAAAANGCRLADSCAPINNALGLLAFAEPKNQAPAFGAFSRTVKNFAAALSPPCCVLRQRNDSNALMANLRSGRSASANLRTTCHDN
jgi:hypothetical protein